jgi:hypothetical protein
MKKLVTITFGAMFLVAVVVSVSVAGYGYHGNCSGMGDMSRLDSDTDDKLTFDEFSAPQMDRLKSAFNMLDTDNDGVISRAEYNEFLKVHGYGDRSEG